MQCISAEGREIARGLSNYSASDAAKLVGAKSHEIAARLGYPGDVELVHRDNLVLI